jgi:PKD repeat protein
VVDDGATGTVVSTNEIQGMAGPPVSVAGASDTAITSNTVNTCSPGISVTGSSAGTSIENNVVNVQVADACPTAGTAYGVQVDSSSAAGTTLDYNDVYATTGFPYSWSGTSYGTAAALHSATGQGEHDYNGSNGGYITEDSPIINSANSAAVGEQPVDLKGQPRTLDPLVTPTGAGPYDYYDRGAIQFQDPYDAAATASYEVSATKVPVGAKVTESAILADTWGDTFDSYEFYFGGGSAPTVSSTPSMTFTATSPGDYFTGVEGAVTGSSTYESLLGLPDQDVDVVAPQPLVPKETLAASGTLGVLASDTGTTDAWNIGSVTFDFGDGTATSTVADGAQASHTYAKPGTYTITETVTDAGGNTATTSSTFTTAAVPAGTLEVVQGSGEAPAGSTGIAQAAIAGVNSSADMRQILAVTTGGQAEFTTGDTLADWQAWQVLNQPGVTVRWAGIAGMPNGSSQLIEVTSTGELLHTVRNADGTWQSTGWGSPAGSTGFTHAAITAMPDGSSQLVAVTTGGVLMHDIRYANGSWQGWRALSQPGVKVVDASIAGLPDGSSQIVEVTSADVMKHDIRYANGSWQSTGWGTPAGSTGITQVSIAAASGGTTEIAAVGADGVGEYTSRRSDGSWSGWDEDFMGPMLSTTDVSVAPIPQQGTELIAVAGD